MEEITSNTPSVSSPEEQSFDIIALVKRLWSKRKFIITITCAFIVIGLVAALMQKPVYTASCTFVPQMSSKRGNAQLSSLALLAGVSTLDLGSSSELSPLIYPQLLDNVDLMKELMYTKFDFEKIDEPITLYDYYTDPQYRISSWFGAYLSYSYGLPITLLNLVLKAIIPPKEEDQLYTATGVVRESPTPDVPYYTKNEYGCMNIIHQKLNMMVEKKEGYFTLTCNMSEKVLAAQVCQATLDLLGKYVTEFKIVKANESNEFIRSLYDKAKIDYEKKQMALAQFQDSNRGAMTATAQTKREQLLAEYNLAYSLYTDLSKQLMQSDMQVKEDTPILAAVKPVVIPNKKSNSRAKTLVIYTFLGAVLACGLVIGLDWLKKQGSSWPKGWTLEEPEPAVVKKEE